MSRQCAGASNPVHLPCNTDTIPHVCQHTVCHLAVAQQAYERVTALLSHSPWQNTRVLCGHADAPFPPNAVLQQNYHGRYLHSKGVDFTRKNKGGNDPLNHAVAYGRRHIAAWLLGEGATSQGLGGANDRRVECERRKDDPVLLDLARLTGDEEMEAFLTGGDLDAVV